MKIKYVGNIEAGKMVDPFTNKGYEFEKGKPIEVPDFVAQKLLKEQTAENPDWVEAAAE